MEAQHALATRKLVDSVEEQLLLEEILEAHKPPAPAVDGAHHYLLTTPFRYPPLAHGSRFGRPHERGIWYGAETVPTAFSEVAYYRMVFLAGTAADLGTVENALTAFRIPVSTAAGIDLTRAPFERYRARLASPIRYDDSQRLGSAMREAGVQAVRYFSARDPQGRSCLAVLDPAAFAARQPNASQTWHCFATRERVEFLRRHRGQAVTHAFARDQFMVQGELPQPAP
ncbi:MAG: RES family NAD+ phosphorylase [Gammaproteobacteria bacterium]